MPSNQLRVGALDRSRDATAGNVPGGSDLRTWHPVKPPASRTWLYTAFVVALWAVVLPGMLVRDSHGHFDLAWRSWPLVVVAGTVLVVGTAAVFLSAGRLGGAGARLMGTTPGPTLVTDGVYARVRNPVDMGTTVISFTSWIALRSEMMWVIPMAAVLHFTLGIGLYEDRRLFEAFGDEFKEYRRRVRKWVPRTPADAGVDEG